MISKIKWQVSWLFNKHSNFSIRMELNVTTSNLYEDECLPVDI